MIRWSFLVPRLIILGLILVAVWISADPLLKYAVVKSTESVTGSKVEVGQVKSSLMKGKVYIKDLAITDPRNPMRNLIQADVAYLQLDPRRLLHRELVIEHGHSTKVMFGAPRTDSGELPNHEYPFEDLTTWLPATVKDEAHEVSQNWMDKFQTTINGQALRDLEFLKVSKQIQDKWPKIFEDKRSRIFQIQSQIATVKRQIETPLQNPLRDLEQLTQATEKSNQLKKQLQDAQLEMLELVKVATTDVQKVHDAKSRDASKINHHVTSTIDAETFSQLLLGNDQSRRLREVINWVRWFRNSIPDPETDFQPSSGRGANIAFQGQKKFPRFLIKTLELDGQGVISGQHFDFAGVAKDLTTEPTLHDQPTTFELRAQGQHHLIVDCTLDRRSETWKDKMQIKCPDLDIPEQNLGDNKSLIVLMRPSRVQADVTIEVEGDKIAGKLEFRHSNCSLYIDQMDQYAGGKDMALRMNQELGQIQQFTTYATLGGTLKDPTISFTSDLGGKFAASMNRILKSQTDQEIVEIQQRLEQRFQNELAGLQRMFQANFADINRQLDGETTAVAELIEDIPEAKQWPSIRR